MTIREDERPLKILRRAQVCERYGFPSTSSLYRAMERSGFPKPIKLGERAVGWDQAEGDDWLEARRAERDKNQAA
jgi:prophage regulatory protein